jgi:signal peptidase I
MPDLLVDFDEFESLATEILQGNRSLRFKARGGSMRPFIHDGDIIEVQNIPFNNLKRGDIAFCRLPDRRLVVHRVIQAKSEFLVIQGDALPYPDGSISQANVLGRIVMLFHKGRRIRLDGFWMGIIVNLWLLLTPLRRMVFRAKFWLLRSYRRNKPVAKSCEP